MRASQYLISIVIPCLNEEGNVTKILNALSSELRHYPDYEIIFVDDGSHDGTLDELRQLSQPHIKYISFTRNFGHQMAIKAGIDHAQGDLIITMDADSEHPVHVIHKLIERWLEGYDIVSTDRKIHAKLPFFKRLTSQMYYRTFRLLSDVDISNGVSDFRLIDAKVADAVRKLNEVNIFWRGIFEWLGYKQTVVSYEQNIREIGESKFNLRRMLALATDGITSFSTKPLHISISLGFAFASLAFTYGIYAVYIKIFTNEAVSGWASLLAGIMFIGGLQFILMGIMGLYLGRLYIEGKQRPGYIVEETSDEVLFAAIEEAS